MNINPLCYFRFNGSWYFAPTQGEAMSFLWYWHGLNLKKEDWDSVSTIFNGRPLSETFSTYRPKTIEKFHHVKFPL